MVVYVCNGNKALFVEKETPQGTKIGAILKEREQKQKKPVRPGEKTVLFQETRRFSRIGTG